MRITIASLSEVVAFCDPASGKTGSSGKARCRTAIVVVGQNVEGRAFVLDAVADRWPTDVITETIYQKQRQWGPRRFGVESSAQQSLYVDQVIREAGMRHIRIAIHPIEQPTNQVKQFRITSQIQKWLHNGLLYINETLSELTREMTRYPNGETCDIVDALASALGMLPDPFSSRKGLVYESDGPKMSNFDKRFQSDDNQNRNREFSD